LPNTLPPIAQHPTRLDSSLINLPTKLNQLPQLNLFSSLAAELIQLGDWLQESWEIG